MKCKAMKCPECNGVNTEYAAYRLKMWRRLPLKNMQSAADPVIGEWDRGLSFDGEDLDRQHWFCNDCFAEVMVGDPKAEKWTVVEIDYDKWLNGDLDNHR